jgi:hypothetical protein
VAGSRVGRDAGAGAGDSAAAAGARHFLVSAASSAEQSWRSDARLSGAAMRANVYRNTEIAVNGL